MKQIFVKTKIRAQNLNLNHLVEASFQGVNKLSVLAFENDEQALTKKEQAIMNIIFQIRDWLKNFFWSTSKK